MMFGRVNQQREAILKLVIIGDGNSKIAVDAVIDTGFNGDLILPIEIVSDLGLVPQGYQKATLGDGTISQFRVGLLLFWGNSVLKHQSSVPSTHLYPLPFPLSPLSISLAYHHNCWRAFRVYAATVIWDGERKLVEVNSATTGILIGMGLLDGYKLEVNATPNGDVSIVKLEI
jgi:predicted aspartyl protease